MKFTVFAMIGAVNALPVMSDASDCTSADGTTCNGASGTGTGLGTASVAAAGLNQECGIATRGQATGTAEYWAKDLWGIYDTLANLSSGRGAVCKTDSQATSPVVPKYHSTPASAICSKATSGTGADDNTNLGTGMWGMTKTFGMNGAQGGSPYLGATLCPQSVDVCDKGTAVMDNKKIATFADAKAAAKTVTILKTIDGK